MLRRVSEIACAICLITVVPPVGASAALNTNITGRWNAIVQVEDVPVPFRFDVSTHGTAAIGYFYDGERHIASNPGTYENGKLHLHFDLYNADLDLTLEGDTLRGNYVRHLAKEDVTRPVTATRYVKLSRNGAGTESIDGNWQLRPVDPKDKADWKMVVQQKGPAVYAAILRLDGDTGALTGTFQDSKLSISHFSGARPALLEGGLQPDGTLALTLDRHLKLKGVREGTEQARTLSPAFDALHATTLKNPLESFRFSGPDPDGKTISSTDPQFHGKVLLLSIGGTWCPNCMDEAPFLVELYRKYHAQGLDILGLNFESGDADFDRARVKTFIAKYNIPYPVIVDGTTDKPEDKLSQLVNFGAYPTTIFVGRDGLVHAIHDGFASVATGAEHTRLKEETDRTIEDLLKQPSS